jgi:parvulin-like peptidyl-prolyl isomerase
MSRIWSVWIMSVTFLPMVWAQSSERSQNSQTRGKENPASASFQVSPDSPVITIDGFCDRALLESGLLSADVESNNCRTVITREQFEKLTATLLPLAPPTAKRQFAQDFPEILLFALKAREMGLDKDPNFQKTLQFTILRALSRGFVKHLQDQAQAISDTEIEKSYKEHPEIFERVDLLRIYVPKEKRISEPGARPNATGGEPAMKAEAEKIRGQAAAGTDFEKLQAQAYTAAGLTDPPDVHVGKETRGTLPLDYQKAVFSLHPGQVSQLIPAPGGYHIFKVLSKEEVPLAEARAVFQALRMKESIFAVKKNMNSQLNEEYFRALPSEDTAKPTRQK